MLRRHCGKQRIAQGLLIWFGRTELQRRTFCKLYRVKRIPILPIHFIFYRILNKKDFTLDFMFFSERFCYFVEEITRANFTFSFLLPIILLSSCTISRCTTEDIQGSSHDIYIGQLSRQRKVEDLFDYFYLRIQLIRKTRDKNPREGGGLQYLISLKFVYLD